MRSERDLSKHHAGIIALAIMILGWQAQAFGVISADDAARLKDLAQHMRASDAKVHNLFVDGSSVVEKRKPGDAGAWEATPVTCHAMGWMQTRASPPYRLKVLQEVMEWSSGTDPFYEMSFEESFDGSRYQHVGISEGPPGSTTVNREGFVTSENRGMLGEGARYTACGRGFTAENINADGGKNLYQMFDWALQSENRPDVVFTCNADTHFDKSLIKFGLVGGNKTVHMEGNYWFDPQHRFALACFEQREGFDNKLMDAMQVLNFVELAQGSWYPCEAIESHTVSASETNDAMERRDHYYGKNIRANDPAIDAEIMAQNIPAGTVMEDRIGAQVLRARMKCIGWVWAVVCAVVVLLLIAWSWRHWRQLQTGYRVNL